MEKLSLVDRHPTTVGVVMLALLFLAAALTLIAETTQASPSTVEIASASTTD
jgi:hypothetical protein